MVEKEKLTKLIELAISQIKEYTEKYKLPDNTSFLKVLQLLKQEVTDGDVNINERVLRGYKDICTSVAIHYEETNFNETIFIINDELFKSIPIYKSLDLLRMDFGKGNPI